jgi:hypothetical protein
MLAPKGPIYGLTGPNEGPNKPNTGPIRLWCGRMRPMAIGELRRAAPTRRRAGQGGRRTVPRSCASGWRLPSWPGVRRRDGAAEQARHEAEEAKEQADALREEEDARRRGMWLARMLRPIRHG